MFLIFVTFLLTTALYGGLLWWFVCRPVFANMKDNAQACQAFTQIIVLPIFGRNVPPKKD
jgi:hypothetical protein